MNYVLVGIHIKILLNLQEDEERVEEDVGCCEGEVGDDADGLPLAVARLRRRPEERVDRVLPEGGKQAVTDLTG